ncbi:ctr copper transporter [Ophiostoma piceae UAMH 11346]|uniref:Copper transport protein n=1 Tax=Ophiostoma piceae (strain UAMH 11346) TaxID=1262450 RepID=S3C5S6_OPHP1|nr:ctr copper transporter [Ophiostoma piceae UAMH 11346]
MAGPLLSRSHISLSLVTALVASPLRALAMDGMDMGSSSSTSSNSSTMMTAFMTGTATSLYSEAWTPSSTGAYAGTCIFLIIFAVIFRGLLALKARAESRWLDAELERRYVVVPGKAGLAHSVTQDSESKRMTLSENGIEEDVMVLKKRHTHVRPWRLSVDPMRALLDTLIAGVGYLLMIAVMSMNVGYFLSILGGTFLGSLLIGRYIVLMEH